MRSHGDVTTASQSPCGSHKIYPLRDGSLTGDRSIITPISNKLSFLLFIPSPLFHAKSTTHLCFDGLENTRLVPDTNFHAEKPRNLKT